MSVDISVTGPGCCVVHDHQFTYNYTPALQEAGFCSWRFLDGLSNSLVEIMVTRLILALGADRARFEPLIRGGGEWGTWDHLIGALGHLAADLNRHPGGQVAIT